MGWKPGALDRLEQALGLLGEDADGDSLGQVAPAVGLLHGSDEDALADGQQVELGKVEVGDVAHAGALGPAAGDDDVLDWLGRERKFERDGPAGAGNIEVLPVDTGPDG